MFQYSLRFELSTRKTSTLILGKLQLMQGQTELNAYTATSSIANRQYRGSWTVKGGLIPPADNYQVATDPIWMPDIKGVEGSFYAITPFEVQTSGAVRGDFGVHFDANVPGSMGCVVLSTQKGWDAFRRDVKAIAAQEVKYLPLTVRYG
jgi:hypothetical protein